jgi:hypothetical protein
MIGRAVVGAADAHESGTLSGCFRGGRSGFGTRLPYQKS